MEHLILRDLDIPNLQDISVYEQHGGYDALRKAVKEMTPDQVTDVVKASGLRGRGGAGFPAGVKWSFLPKGVFPRYLVANADESEPGTFKDRQIMERNPHQFVEGIAIASYAIQCHNAFIYIRGEFPYAAQCLEKALADAEQRGYVGKNVLGSDYSLTITVHRGAGAYICGEETALIESLEGKRGEPRIRPPYPVTFGIWGNATAVNNVESLANLPPIIRKGAAWYRTIGTAKCPGTKVYTMLGDVNVTGLIEVPMGTSLRTVIQVYGGGMKGGKPFKLAQTGGASGSILDASFLDVPMDFAELASRGAGLGSGALLICGEDTCVVDLAYVLLRFFANESCGKCVPCRIGTTRAEEILAQLTDARATIDDLAQLERIATNMQVASFCGLGQAAAVPILTGLRFFRDEFVAHADARKCPVGVCAMRGECVLAARRLGWRELAVAA